MLDGVRDDCLGKDRHSIGTDLDRPMLTCAEAGCLSYTPAKDLAKWLGAAAAVGLDRIDILYSGKWYVAFQKEDAYSGDTPEEAFYAALYEACRPLAVNPEAEEFVLKNVV